MRQSGKFSGFFQQSNNRLFGGKIIKLNGPLGCLLIIFLWPILVLALLGFGLFMMIRAFFRRPRVNRGQAPAGRPDRDGVIDVEVIPVDERPERRTIPIQDSDSSGRNDSIK